MRRLNNAAYINLSKYFFALFLSFAFFYADAQVTDAVFGMAYRDYRNYLYYFKDGVPQQLETQPVRSYRSKGVIAAYVNSANNLIAYYNGEKTELDDATNTTFDLTDHLLIYHRDQVLGVFDKGKRIQLTFFIRDYKFNDEMVAFREQNIDLLKVYYKGNITELDYTLIGTLGDYKAGKNTVAYINGSGYFKIFDAGQTYEIDNIAPLSFDAGKDIVGYVDGSKESLNAFYDSKVLTLEQIKPLSFQAGDDLLAYVSDEGYFKVFSKGKLIKVESYTPDFYSTKDGSVLFFADNKLQLMQDGVRYELDNFRPLSYQMSNNCIAWQDPSKRLFLFSDGKVQEVTSEIYVNYELNGNVLRYELDDGTSHIYYNGKTY